jgi:hypothetical protein
MVAPLLHGSIEELRPNCLALIVGNGRSGTTIVGSILDAHPRMICANETDASRKSWQNCSRTEILQEIIENSTSNYETGRSSEGYEYRIGTQPKDLAAIEIIADKIWNPTIMMLHGAPGLLHELAAQVECPIRLIHCVRHPLDVIATMHQRSGATLLDRARWYFMKCEAAQALLERELMLTVFHEKLLREPVQQVHRIYHYLGQDTPPETINSIARTLYPEPRVTRNTVSWSADVLAYIKRQKAEFAFLDGYEI